MLIFSNINIFNETNCVIEFIQISIGGGEKAEEFLNRNGFHIIRKREYKFEVDNNKMEGKYGIDAVRRV